MGRRLRKRDTGSNTEIWLIVILGENLILRSLLSVRGCAVMFHVLCKISSYLAELNVNIIRLCKEKGYGRCV